jgi:hypothetical protein
MALRTTQVRPIFLHIELSIPTGVKNLGIVLGPVRKKKNHQQKESKQHLDPAPWLSAPIDIQSKLYCLFPDSSLHSQSKSEYMFRPVWW